MHRRCAPKPGRTLVATTASPAPSSVPGKKKPWLGKRARPSAGAAAAAAAGRSSMAIDFKRRPALFGASAAVAAAAASEYDRYWDYWDSDEEEPPVVQVSNTSNITIQRQAQPAVSRPSDPVSRPPPPPLLPSTKNGFSAGAPTWVLKKAETPAKPAPKPAAGSSGGLPAPRGVPIRGPTWAAAVAGETSAGNEKGAAVAAAAAALNGLSLAARGPPPAPAPAPALVAARAADGSLQYRKPVGFKTRSSRLVQQARELFPWQPEFYVFKELSKAFREADLCAEDYYCGCMYLLGNDKLSKMFPELLVLLPNIVKQRALLAVLKKHNTNLFQWSTLSSCPTCGQVLVSDDLAQHTAQHVGENGNFPVRGRGSGDQ